MTLSQKRKIVQWFLDGASTHVVQKRLQERSPYTYIFSDLIEAVIRDYMNGKVSLKPKTRRKKK